MELPRSRLNLRKESASHTGKKVETGPKASARSGAVCAPSLVAAEIEAR